MSTLLTRRRRTPGINIVPLLDVMTILIFFFLVSMQFREQHVLKMVMPKIDTAGQSEAKDMVVVGIDVEGRIFVRGVETSENDLERLAREIAVVNTDMPVLLKADEDTPVKKMLFVMDAFRKVGLNKIQIQSRSQK